MSPAHVTGDLTELEMLSTSQNLATGSFEEKRDFNPSSLDELESGATISVAQLVTMGFCDMADFIGQSAELVAQVNDTGFSELTFRQIQWEGSMREASEHLF